MELDFSGRELTAMKPVFEEVDHRRVPTETVVLSRNLLTMIPRDFYKKLAELVELDISDNQLETMADGLSHLKHLRVLDARNNQLRSLPSDFSKSHSLAEINLAGNLFDRFPSELCDMPKVEKVWLGSNGISEVPRQVSRMEGLQHLFLGGNRLSTLPEEIGLLPSLHSLGVCHNSLTSLPHSVTTMKTLRSIQVHNNCLETLPTSLLHMTQLREISLRNNPLVSRFVRDFIDEVPSLLELAARCVKGSGYPYAPGDLPASLIDHLDNGQQCDNPQCRGVYFNAVFKQVKFVDFCGKYRVPFMHYLCSPQCRAMAPGHSSAWSSSSEDEDAEERRMKKVLIG